MVDIAPLTLAATDLAAIAEPIGRYGVCLSPAPPCNRYSLRAKDRALLETLAGTALPQRIGDTHNGYACLGPDEWYALLPEGITLPQTEGQPVSIVDVSARAVGLLVEGDGAADLIATGCPLDIARMAPGRATRTHYESVEIQLWCLEETRFHLEVWRSFAPWLGQALLANLPD